MGTWWELPNFSSMRKIVYPEHSDRTGLPALTEITVNAGSPVLYLNIDFAHPVLQSASHRNAFP